MKKIILFIFICYFAQTQAQQGISVDSVRKGKFVPFVDSIKIKQEKNYSLLVVPLGSYQPETSVALGLGVILFVKPFKNDSITRPSSFYGTGMYTFKKQILTAFQTTYWHKRNAFSSGIDFLYQRYPNKFFGLGNDVGDYFEYFDSDQIKINVNNRKKILPYTYLGLDYRYRYNKMTKTTDGGLFQQGIVPGGEGSSIQGVEISINYDNRNDEFYPTKGNYMFATYSNFGGVLGGDFGFRKYKIELRHYHEMPYAKNHIVALRLLGEFGNGAIPFNYMSQLGGPGILRGYFEGKYREKNIINADFEYRLPITNRIKFHAFGGFGAVAEEWSKFKTEYFKLSGGGGLRYKIFKDKGMHIRVDVGFGYKTWGTYVQLSEAF